MVLGRAVGVPSNETMEGGITIVWMTFGDAGPGPENVGLRTVVCVLAGTVEIFREVKAGAVGVSPVAEARAVDSSPTAEVVRVGCADCPEISVTEMSVGSGASLELLNAGVTGEYCEGSAGSDSVSEAGFSVDNKEVNVVSSSKSGLSTGSCASLRGSKVGLLLADVDVSIMGPELLNTMSLGPKVGTGPSPA